MGWTTAKRKWAKCVTIRPRKSFLMKIKFPSFIFGYHVDMIKFLCEIKIWFSWWCRKRFSRFDSGAFLLSPKTNWGKRRKFSFNRTTGERTRSDFVFTYIALWAACVRSRARYVDAGMGGRGKKKLLDLMETENFPVSCFICGWHFLQPSANNRLSVSLPVSKFDALTLNHLNHVIWASKTRAEFFSPSRSTSQTA